MTRSLLLPSRLAAHGSAAAGRRRAALTGLLGSLGAMALGLSLMLPIERPRDLALSDGERRK